MKIGEGIHHLCFVRSVVMSWEMLTWHRVVRSMAALGVWIATSWHYRRHFLIWTLPRYLRNSRMSLESFMESVRFVLRKNWEWTIFYPTLRSSQSLSGSRDKELTGLKFGESMTIHKAPQAWLNKTAVVGTNNSQRHQQTQTQRASVTQTLHLRILKINQKDWQEKIISNRRLTWSSMIGRRGSSNWWKSKNWG